MSEKVINASTKAKKKYEKAEDFIGETFNDGKLKVIGILERRPYGVIYKVTCTECSKDPELFPLGYFTSLKSDLKAGSIPCGCAISPRWEETQCLIRVNRVVNGKFIIHGFSEHYKGKNTKLDCECPVDGFKWTPTLHNVLRGKSNCPHCAMISRRKIFQRPYAEVIMNCRNVCEQKNYTFVGFCGEYENCNSLVEYLCPIHGSCVVPYRSLVERQSKCYKCHQEYMRKTVCFYGWYPERAEEKDFLYVMNFNDYYIKVGRSFNVPKRLRELKNISKCLKIKTLSVYTSTHREVYDLEQELHDELHNRGFGHTPDTWYSTETFDTDCLFILNNLLDLSGIERVK